LVTVAVWAVISLAIGTRVARSLAQPVALDASIRAAGVFLSAAITGVVHTTSVIGACVVVHASVVDLAGILGARVLGRVRRAPAVYRAIGYDEPHRFPLITRDREKNDRQHARKGT
jgi:hypothetical protein